MTYSVQTWSDNNASYPVSAARMSHVENGILNADLRLTNVKDSAYGAVGDGTTNDYTAVTSAITAAGATGIVYFPPGTYKITTGGTSLAPPSGQTWLLNQAILVCGDESTTNTNLIFCKPAGDFTVFGWGAAEFRGCTALGAGGITSAIETWATSGNIRVRGVRFTKHSFMLRRAPSLASTVSFYVENCTFTGRADANAGAGLIHMSTAAAADAYLHVHNCVFNGMGKPSDNHCHGLYIYPDINVHLEACRFDGATANTGTGWCVHLYDGGTGSAPKYHRIVNCHFNSDLTVNEIVNGHVGELLVEGCTFLGPLSALTAQAGTVRFSNCYFGGSRSTNSLLTPLGGSAAGLWLIENCDFAVTSTVQLIAIDSINNYVVRLRNCRWVAGGGAFAYFNAGTGYEFECYACDFTGTGVTAITINNAARVAFHDCIWRGGTTGLYQPAATTWGRFEAFNNQRLAAMPHTLSGTRTQNIEVQNYNESGVLHTFS